MMRKCLKRAFPLRVSPLMAKRGCSVAAGDPEGCLPPPLVGIPSCYREDPEGNFFQSFHSNTDKYPRSVAHSAQVLPVSIPALKGAGMGDRWADDYVQNLDGIFLTGSPSNIHPTMYDGGLRVPPFDQNRDMTSLPLIRAAISANLPILAICRGLQELNVATGGTLIPDVDRRFHGYPTDFIERAEGEPEDQDIKYGPAHSVRLSGVLGEILGAEEIMVNTAHYQAIERLGEGLVSEAIAPDGVIEAVRIMDLDFGVAVQWHPEYLQWPHEGRDSEDFQGFKEHSKRLFKAFGAACRRRQGKRK